MTAADNGDTTSLTGSGGEAAAAADNKLKWVGLCAVAATVGVGAAAYWLYSRSKVDSCSANKQPVVSTRPAEDEVDLSTLSGIDRASELKRRGNMRFKRANYDEAIQFYSEAIDCFRQVTEPDEKKMTDLAACFQNKAAAYEKLSNYEAVLENCREALKLSPRYIKALSRLSDALVFQEQLEQALVEAVAVLWVQEDERQTDVCMKKVEEIVHKNLEKTLKSSMLDRPKQPVSASSLALFSELFFDDPIWTSVFDADKKTSTPVPNGQRPENVVGEEGEVTISDDVNSDENGPDAASSQQIDAATACSAPEVVEGKRESFYKEAISFLRKTIRRGYATDDQGNVDVNWHQRCIKLLDNELAYADSTYRNECLVVRGSLNALRLDRDGALGDLRKVADDLQAPVRLRAHALVKISMCYANTLDQAEAELALKDAEKLCPNSPDVLFTKTQLEPTSLESNRLKMQQIIRKAERGYAAFDIQTAFIDLQMHLQQNAIMPDPRLLDDFLKLLANYSESPTAWVCKLELLLGMGKLADLLRDIDDLLKKMPDQPLLLMQKVLCKCQLESMSGGDEQLSDNDVASLKQLLSRDPGLEMAHSVLASSLMGKHKFNEAISHLEASFNASQNMATIPQMFIRLMLGRAFKECYCRYGASKRDLTNLMAYVDPRMRALAAGMT